MTLDHINCLVRLLCDGRAPTSPPTGEIGKVTQPHMVNLHTLPEPGFATLDTSALYRHSHSLHSRFGRGAPQNKGPTCPMQLYPYYYIHLVDYGCLWEDIKGTYEQNHLLEIPYEGVKRHQHFIQRWWSVRGQWIVYTQNKHNIGRCII